MKRKKLRPLFDRKLCYQALSIIKLLGAISMEKLDLKHDPRLRRIVLLDWVGQVEIALLKNE